MNGSDEDWIRYDVLLTKFTEDFDDKTKEENTSQMLERFYEVVEKVVKLVFEKKEVFKTEEERKSKKKNKIPQKIRILLRKKTSLSKKIIASSSAKTTLRLMKTLQGIEKELEDN